MKKTFLRVILFTVTTLLLMSGAAMADEYKNYISVTGKAAKEYAPDTATICMSVVTSGNTAEVANQRNVEIINRVMNSLAVYGISKRDIKTADYSMNPKYVNDGKGNRREKGYELHYTLNVKVKDIKKTGAVIDRMLADGVNRFQYVSFGLSNREEIERSLLASAVENARTKALVVAEAGGRSLGALCYAAVDGVGGMTYANRDMSLAKAASNAPTEVSGGTLKVSVSVQAEFQMQ